MHHSLASTIFNACLCIMQWTILGITQQFSSDPGFFKGHSKYPLLTNNYIHKIHYKINLLSFKKYSSHQNLTHSYCLWLYRHNAVYATRKRREISNFYGIWFFGYRILSIHPCPPFVYDWSIYLLINRSNKRVFSHFKAIIKSKKGSTSHILTSTLIQLNPIYTLKYRGHTPPII